MIMNKAIKGEKGVTLMVLVVSIIILLIISAIVITNFNKEGTSLIDTTEKQSEELRQMSARQKIEVEAEKIKLANVNTKNYGISTFIDDLQSSLQKYDSNAEVELNSENSDDLYDATFNGYTFSYYYDGNGNGVAPVPVKVARIVTSPITALEGTEYESLLLAIRAIENAGLSASNNATKIQLLANISSESNTIVDQNIVLDLAEHTLNSNRNLPTLTIQSGSLNVIDSVNNEFVGNGTIRNTKVQAIKIETNGKFTIGADEGTVSNTPIIQGVNYGVENIGEFNFYDGIIKGTNAISDVEAQIGLPHLRSIGVYPEGTIQSAQLDILQKVEARIGKKEFVTLESAIDYANTRINTNGSQVTIQIVEQTVENQTVSGITKNSEVTIPSGKNIKIDMNGLTSTFNASLVNNGTLEIIDSVGGGKFVSSTGVVISNNANARLTVTSGAVEININQNIAAITSSGSLFINGGNVTGNAANNPQSDIIPYGVKCNNSGSVYVNGGTIDGRGGLQVNGATTLVVNDGATIKSYYYRALDIQTTATSTINGGSIESSNQYSNIWGLICHQGTGLVKIEDIDINLRCGGRGIYNELGKMEITYASIHDGGGYTTAIETWYDMDIEDIDITDGDNGIYAAYGDLNIEHIDCVIPGSCIYNSWNSMSDTKNIVVNGGTLRSTDPYRTTISFGYFVDKLTLNNTNVQGGTCAIGADPKVDEIEIKGNSTITTTNTYSPLYNGYPYTTISLGDHTNLNIISGTVTGNLYGIYRSPNATSGTITLGTKNTNVSTTSPSVTGVNNYGIYSTQPINIYSGRINGYYAENQCGALFGSINEISDNYVLKKEVNNTTQSIYLAAAQDVAKVNSTSRTYRTLQEAISNTAATDTIEIVNGTIIIGSDADIKIPAGKNLTIDFKGKTIEVLAGDKIENKGTLLLTDSTATLNADGTLNTSGALKGDGVSNFISNTGTLTIEKMKVSAQDNVISSSGNITVKTGNVASETGSRNISLSGTANLNVIDKGIVSGGRVITNDGTGTVTIENGIVRNNDYRQYVNAISNLRTGAIIVKGDSEIKNSSMAAIYNESTGTVDIYNGIVYNTSSDSCINNHSTGTITIHNGAIKGPGVCIYNENENGRIIIEGGTIGGRQNSPYGSTVGIQFRGYINMSGGTITNVDVGLQQESWGSANITITAGTITGYQSAYCWEPPADRDYTANIVLGTHDGVVDNNNSPIHLTSTSQSDYYRFWGMYAGVPTKVHLEYYDGIVTGYLDKTRSINRAMNIIPEVLETGFDVIKEETANTESAMLKSFPLIRNKTINKEYFSIQEALNEAANGTNQKMELLRNKTLLTTETFNVGASKDIELDLNGFMLSIGAEKQIENNGTLKIVDSSTDANKIGTLSSNTGYLLYNKGTLIIDGGKYIGRGHIIENEGTLTVNNSTNIVSTVNGSTGIYNNNGTVTFNNGTFNLTSNEHVLYKSSVEIDNVGNSGTVTINNGTFNGGGGPNVRNYDNGTVTINNGTFTEVGSTNIYNRASGTITILGGTYSTTYNGYVFTNGIFNEASGTINISNATITSGSSYAVTNNGAGTININSGSISNEWTYTNAVYNVGAGTINISGGTITSPANIAVLNNAGGTLQVTGGTISGTIGVANTNAGNLTVGVKDGEPNPGVPSITGTTSYGVSSPNKEFSFYGGTITGTNNPSVNGGIKEYDTNCDLVRTDNGNNTETSTLQKNLKLVKNLTTGTEYPDLPSAVTAASNNDTLQVRRHKIYASTENTTTIPSGKNITIDLNGYEVYFVKENGITNKGSLTITDSTANKKGQIKSYANSAIKNEGTLNIQNGTIEGAYQSITNNVVDLAGGNAILNTGTVNMTGGKVKSISTAITNTGTVNGNGGTLDAVADIYNNEGGVITTASASTIVMNGTYGIINNSNTGSITYNGGTISTTTHGIRNEKTCEIKVKGGTIETTGRSDIALYNVGTGTIEVDGAIKIASHGYADYGGSGIIPYPANVLLNASSGKIDVKNTIIQLTNYGQSGINNSSGEIEINHCTIYGNMQQLGSGKITILNNSSLLGQFYANGTGSTNTIQDSSITCDNNAVHSIANSNIKLKNADITITGSGNNYVAVNNAVSTGTIEIEGGTITAEGDSTIGIRNFGILIIGKKDLIYDDSKPDIYGKAYGVYNETSGTVKFYDGLIKSASKAIYGNVAEVEDDYKLSITNVEKEARLTPSGTTQAVATIGSMNFMSLQLAVDSITTGTIEIRTDIELGAPVNIPAGKNITINKNGYSVTYNGSSANAFNVASGATLTLNN